MNRSWSASDVPVTVRIKNLAGWRCCMIGLTGSAAIPSRSPGPKRFSAFTARGALRWTNSSPVEEDWATTSSFSQGDDKTRVPHTLARLRRSAKTPADARARARQRTLRRHGSLFLSGRTPRRRVEIDRSPHRLARQAGALGLAALLATADPTFKRDSPARPALLSG